MLREQFDNLTATNNSLCATNERLQQSKQQLVIITDTVSVCLIY